MMTPDQIIDYVIQHALVAWGWPYAGYLSALLVWLTFVIPMPARLYIASTTALSFLYWGCAPWLWELLASRTAWLQDRYPDEWWQHYLHDLLVGIVCLAAVTFMWLRWVQPQLFELSHRLTRRSRSVRSLKTDVRSIDKHLPPPREAYNPIKYFKRERGLFAGLNLDDKPVYIPYHVWKSSHVQIVGTTGFGKGVVAGTLLTQALEHGETVVVLDPKDDEYGPHVSRAAAEWAGKPFYLVDLRAKTPQINLLSHATAWDVEERLIASFSLAERGEAADYYRIADRRAARAAGYFAGDRNMTLSELYREMAGREEYAEASGFLGRLEEMSTLRSINAQQGGVDLYDLIENGGCLYVIGSMRHARVITAQRMLLIQLVQIAEKRDRTLSRRTLRIFLDEMKYHISRAALEVLGAARDKGIGLILAHQSLADLRDCPADLNGDAVVGAVVENCSLRFAYRLQDPVTAEWLAAMSGTILVDDEMRTVERNSALAESISGDRTLRQGDRYYVDTNMLLNLPKGCAVLYGNGTGCDRAQLVHISPMVVKKSPLHISAAVDMAATQNRPDSSSVSAASLIDV